MSRIDEALARMDAVASSERVKINVAVPDIDEWMEFICKPSSKIDRAVSRFKSGFGGSGAKYIRVSKTTGSKDETEDFLATLEDVL